MDRNTNDVQMPVAIGCPFVQIVGENHVEVGSCGLFGRCYPGQLEKNPREEDGKDNDAPVVSGCPCEKPEENFREVDNRDSDVLVVSGCPSG